MAITSPAALLAEYGQPLVIDDVTFEAPGADQILVKPYQGPWGGVTRPERDFPMYLEWDQINDAVHDLEQGRILGRSIITFDA